MDSEEAINSADILLRPLANARIGSRPAERLHTVKPELQFSSHENITQNHMDSEKAINSADCLLRPLSNARISRSQPSEKHPAVKQELQFLRISESLQDQILDTLHYIHGSDFTLKDASDYRDEKSNLGKKFWIDQGTLVVKGGFNFSQNPDNAVEESDRLKQFSLFRLESYGFHQSHCVEALNYCSGDIEHCLYLLYSKYFNIPYPFPKVITDIPPEELLEQRNDEKSSLESIYEKSFEEKVKNTVWVLKLKLDYLVNIFHNKNLELPKKNPTKHVKEKEKCKLFVRGTCKYGDKCRFSHKMEDIKPDINSHLHNFVFDLEIRFQPNSQYPFEPPIIFLRTNAVLPPLVNLHICKRLLEEANSLAKDGIPSIYTVAELLQSSDEITDHLKKQIDFIGPRVKLFDVKETIPSRKRSSHYKRGATNKDNKRSYSEEEICREDKIIVRKFKEKLDKEQFREMLQSRRKLPVWQYMKDILNTVESSQVTIISGETGCGKSTQVPQYLLDDWIVKQQENSRCHINIICTQPRRISAVSVAERVAQERLEKVGNTVGYQIRLESKMSVSTRLSFCTTGILLRRLESDPLMTGVTHILVDEVHERSEESDFLLMILRDTLPQRPDLKVILMSATLKAELFCTYFNDIPIIEVPGRTFPVQQFFLEDIFETYDYIIEEHSEFSRRTPKDPDYVESQLAGGEVLLMSEKPKTALKDECLNFRQICTRYEDYSVRTWKNLFRMEPDKINNELIEYLLDFILWGEHNYPKTGTILIFLPGIAEITSLYDRLSNNPNFSWREKKILLLPLHSSLSNEEQAAIFRKYQPGVRKIVLSTNLAETSITIDDCIFVIDTGKMKEKHFDPNRNMESLETAWVARANALQRKGRAGRVMAGICFHLYTSHRFNYNFLGQPVPEIHRVPLEKLILNIKLLQCFDDKDVQQVLGSFIEPPATDSVHSAISRLQSVGALDQEGELTALGQHLATLPVDVRIGKLILYGAIFSCLDAALTMGACLSFRSIFLTPFDKKDLANAKKQEFAVGCSDQMAVLNAYTKWLKAHKVSPLAGRNFAHANYLSLKTLVSIADVKYQFLELLVDIGFVSVNLNHKRRTMGTDDVANLTGNEFNKCGENYRLLSSVLCAALYPNVVKILTPPKSFMMSAGGAVAKEINAKDIHFSTAKEKVFMHPSSINYKTSNYPSPYLVYQEKVRTSKIFIRDCSMVSVISLVLFTGYDLDIKVHNGCSFISLENGWIMLQVEEHKVAEMIKMIKMELLELLEEKVKDPLLNLHNNDKSYRIITTILRLISS